MPSGAISGEGSAWVRMRANLLEQFQRPHLGVFRWTEPIQKPGVSLALPFWQSLAGITKDYFQRKIIRFVHEFAIFPRANQLIGQRLERRPSRQRHRQIAGAHRIHLKTCDFQTARDPGISPQIPSGQHIQASAKPQFRNVKPIAESIGKPISVQENVVCFG